MKQFSIITCLLFFFQLIHAQGFGFVAKKEHRSYIYPIGTPVRINLNNDSLKKVKGYYARAVENGIYISPFSINDSASYFVPTNQINSVIQLSRKPRKTLFYAAAGGLALTGIFSYCFQRLGVKFPNGLHSFSTGVCFGLCYCLWITCYLFARTD